MSQRISVDQMDISEQLQKLCGSLLQTDLQIVFYNKKDIISMYNYQVKLFVLTDIELSQSNLQTELNEAAFIEQQQKLLNATSVGFLLNGVSYYQTSINQIDSQLSEIQLTKSNNTLSIIIGSAIALVLLLTLITISTVCLVKKQKKSKQQQKQQFKQQQMIISKRLESYKTSQSISKCVQIIDNLQPRELDESQTTHKAMLHPLKHVNDSFASTKSLLTNYSTLKIQSVVEDNTNTNIDFANLENELSDSSLKQQKSQLNIFEYLNNDSIKPDDNSKQSSYNKMIKQYNENNAIQHQHQIVKQGHNSIVSEQMQSLYKKLGVKYLE
ncbi:Hypothetical_protein [Hexamita inflata]|uniref:Hypothetical_protein n=1 Tax=Hexamita inflata TaxID=28002 RepID=A0AA86PQX0_9EUKA|nr:Hypothetical protein HINF_LOCUS30716 [Hexamita inflata]